MADFITGDIKTARARFLGADGTEKAVQGDVTWSVTPDGAVLFTPGTGAALTNTITMGAPTNGVVVSASADKNMNPDIDVQLPIASQPFNILGAEAEGGEVVIE